MRFLLRTGLALGLITAACGKDSPAPTDFEDPAAVTADVAAVGEAFDNDVFRSFSATTFLLGSAAPQPVAPLLQATRPMLERAGAQAFLPGLKQARQLQAALPNLSANAAQGRIIPDSMYTRVFEWDADLSDYTYQGTTVTGLTGVRFILYAVGLDGLPVVPTTEIGYLDIIDQSTVNTLQLLIQVKGPGGTPTYVSYTVSLVVNGETSAVATASGTISNGLTAGDNKTLTFDETFTLNQDGARANATFALNNPVLTLILIESISFDEPNLVITADFRIVQPGETIRTSGRVTIDLSELDPAAAVTVNVTVYVNNQPVASINGNPADPATVWVDAGGEPLTAADLVALDALFEAFENFQLAVEGLFAPIATFAGF